MNAHELLERLSGLGLTCRRTEDKLVVTPGEKVTAEIRALIPPNKEALLAALDTLLEETELWTLGRYLRETWGTGQYKEIPRAHSDPQVQAGFRRWDALLVSYEAVSTRASQPLAGDPALIDAVFMEEGVL